jgi:predicted AlkP superfamily phosphohydrolase/phosphomutase
VWWKLLRSALLASTLLATQLVSLTLYLNPSLSLAQHAGAIASCLLLPWTALAFLGLGPAALVLAALPAPRAGLRPVFPGHPWVTTLLLAALLLAGALFAWNLHSYSHAIPVAAVKGLLASTVVTVAAALVLFGIAIDVLLFPERRRGAGPGLMVLALAAAVLVPLALRPAPEASPTPVRLRTERTAPLRRVTIIGLDGLGPADVGDAASRARLPAFARLARLGAHGPLATVRPTEGPPVWTSIVTGRLPREHGVKSFVSYGLARSAVECELLPKGALVGALERLGLVEPHAVTSTARRRPALWHAAGAFGVTSGVVRVFATWPVEPLAGFMLSPYHQASGAPGEAASRNLHPPDLQPEVDVRGVQPQDLDRALLAEFVDPAVEVPADEVPEGAADLLPRALAADLTFQRAAEVLRAAYDPPLFIGYHYGLDRVGHVFTRFAHPEHFGNVSPEAVRKYGRVTERYAALLGDWADAEARALEPDEVLLVVSGYGMEPVGLWRRALDTLLGEGGRRSGTHQGAPAGYLFAVGAGIRPGAVVQDASVLDVAPTALYLMGLPVARDMEGRVLTEILQDDVARAQPITFVPSYESLAVTQPHGAEGLEPPPLSDEP